LSREEFSARVKRAAFKRAGGKCEGCERPIVKGRHEFDHDVEAWEGGDASLENCKVLCSGGAASCHSIKSKRATARRAKADAQKAQANNLKGPKKKFDRPPKPERVSKPLPPRRAMYKEIE
jgi:5-methylcytosine-specific restriction endonuclease McrA